jgi:hypothetical protein
MARIEEPSLENSCKPFVFCGRDSPFSWFAYEREDSMSYSLENSHNPFIFKGRVAAIFMVRLWLVEP